VPSKATSKFPPRGSNPYVGVSRAKTNLSLYTADREKLFKQAERSAAKENPSDYLTLFNLVNPDAENEKTAGAAREVRGADQSEYLGDRAGECVAHSHRAAVRRDRSATAGSERATSRAASVTPQYVADVRGVVAGIAERRRAAELEWQAERIGEATQGVIDGAGQLEHTATAVARLDEQLEREAERLGEPAMVEIVAELILKGIGSELQDRATSRSAEAKTSEPPVKNKQEQSKQRQKKQAKKRDQGMEM